MKLGIRQYVIFFFFLISTSISANEHNLELENIKPSFDLDEDEDTIQNDDAILKNFFSSDETLNDQYLSNNQLNTVSFFLLDKLTAKKNKYSIKIKEIKKIEDIEVSALDCRLVQGQNKTVFVAYLQIKDLSNTNQDQIFVYNGWMFSSNRSKYSVEHSLYDIWVQSCN